MTQINDINGNAVIQTSQRKTVSSATGFENTFSKALDRTSATENGGEKPAALGEPNSPHFNRTIAPSVIDVACQTESLLGLLESYAEGLENPDATLKDLSFLVERIKDEAQQLIVSADTSTSAGNDLKGIASQTALTASVEYIKFQRGDFI